MGKGGVTRTMRPSATVVNGVWGWEGCKTHDHIIQFSPEGSCEFLGISSPSPITPVNVIAARIVVVEERNIASYVDLKVLWRVGASSASPRDNHVQYDVGNFRN